MGNLSLTTVLLVVAGIALVAVLYRFFYRERDTGGTDQRNWVNDSNYNVATSDSESEAIEGASPAEAKHMVDVNKDEGPYPPSDEEFHAIEKKVDGSPHDSGTVKERLRDADS